MIKNVFSLFSFKERIQLFGLLCLILLTSFLEMVGVGIIFPYMNIITNDKLINSNYYLNFFYSNFGFSNKNSFIIFLSIFLVLIIIIKNVLYYFFHYIQQTFILMKRLKMTNLMFRGYLKSSYEYHINNNSIILWRNLTQVDGVFTGLLQPILSLIAEGTIVFFILIMMLLTEFELTIISLIIILLPTIVMQRAHSSKLKKLGKKSFILTGTSSKILFEAFGAIKDIFIMGIQSIFSNRYIKQSIELGMVRRDISLIGMTPRLVLEPIITASLICAILVILIFQEKTVGEVLPILALFATATFRILNSISKIIINLQSLDFNQILNKEIVSQINYFKSNPMVFNYDDFDNENKKLQIKKFQRILELKNISYSYPNSKQATIHNLSLKIKKGSFVAIVGESGAGKSTLADIILGLLKPNKGQIILDGSTINPSLDSLKGLFGFVPQTIFLSDDTIKNNIAFGTPEDLIDIEKVNKATKISQLEKVIEEQSKGLETKIGEKGVRLSGGQLQRIGIARALYFDPEIIVFDEATSALDGKTELNVSQSIESLLGKKTVIVIAHRLSTIKNCDCIYFMKDGRIVDYGNFKYLYSKNAAFRDMAGNQVK